jgi:hypothetical protein
MQWILMKKGTGMRKIWWVTLVWRNIWKGIVEESSGSEE